MSDVRDLLRVGRPVSIQVGPRIGVVGIISDYDEELDLYLVNTTLGSQSGHHWHELKPLFTFDQVVSAKVEEETTPALVKAVAPFGMSSDELAQACAEEIAECVTRIKGVGNDQYSEGGHQKFETLDLDELFEYSLEELQDIMNYTVFLTIRLRRIQKALNGRDDLGVGTDEEFEQTDYSVEDFQEEDNG